MFVCLFILEYQSVRIVTNTEQLLQVLLFNSFKCTKEKIIINCNSGEMKTFIVKNPHGNSEIVTALKDKVKSCLKCIILWKHMEST